jgi:hypothetical protein
LGGCECRGLTARVPGVALQSIGGSLGLALKLDGAYAVPGQAVS